MVVAVLRFKIGKSSPDWKKSEVGDLTGLQAERTVLGIHASNIEVPVSKVIVGRRHKIKKKNDPHVVSLLFCCNCA